MRNMIIDRKLLPMKAHYFLFNAGTAPVVPFMPTLARQLGFSTIVVGTIYTILPVIGMLAKPLFGVVADRFRRHKFLFLLFQLITAISFFCINFIPSVEQMSSVQLHCNNGMSDLRFCPVSTQLDKCVEEKLEERYTNSTIECQLNCEVSPSHWKIICRNWGVIEKCDLNRSTLGMTVFVPMSHIETTDGGKCLTFLFLRGQMNGKNTTMYCPSEQNFYFETTCDINCNDEYIKDTISETKIGNKSILGIYQFWLFFLFLVVSWIGMAVVVSVGDTICFEMLGDQHFLYGNQRLWGAVGWGVFSIISGILVDKMSGGAVFKDYTIAFYMTLVIICMDMAVSTRLEHSQTKLSTNILKDVRTIFLSLKVVIFFVWCIIVGLCTALIWNFLFWHLEDLASEGKGCHNQDFMKTLQGFAMGIQCFGGELPFFFLSGWILKKIGHINAMSLVLFGFGIRFLLYYILQNPWWVLPIELLNGITFGIFYSTMASYASIVAPPGTEATLQGLVGAVFEGIGVSTGSFIGGVLFKAIGGSKTFLLFGVCTLCAFAIHVVVQWVLQKHGKYGIHASYTIPNDAIHMLDDQEINSTT